MQIIKEGSKVLFGEEAGRIYLANSSMEALREAQVAFAGKAERLGLETDDGVIERFKHELNNKNKQRSIIMNTIKNEFDEIVKLCEEKVEEYGERASYFLEPVTEEEIVEWERETGIQIPEDYRQWLKLTGTCQMCSNIASLVFPETKQPDFLPDDYVLIGYVVGDGEVLCFSKSTGKYITYFEGKVNRTYDEFMMILYRIKKSIKGEAPKIKFTEDKIRAMMAELEEIRKNKGEIR